MKKKIKYSLLSVLVILFFLAFIPVRKIETPKNYWDSGEYNLISPELDSLFKIYSENVPNDDTLSTREVIVHVHVNQYYTSVFGLVRRGRREQKTKTVGYLKKSDCLELFPDNPGKVVLLKRNYNKIVTFLRQYTKRKSLPDKSLK